MENMRYQVPDGKPNDMRGGKLRRSYQWKGTSYLFLSIVPFFEKSLLDFEPFMAMNDLNLLPAGRCGPPPPPPPPEEGQVAGAHAADAQPRPRGQEGGPRAPLQGPEDEGAHDRPGELHVQVPGLHDGLPPPGDAGETLADVMMMMMMMMTMMTQ